MDIQVQHDADNTLFYFEVDGMRGELDYRKRNENTVDFHSTFVHENLRERGFATQMIEFALNYARENGWKVEASCPMVAHYLEEHTEFNDMKADH